MLKRLYATLLTCCLLAAMVPVLTAAASADAPVVAPCTSTGRPGLPTTDRSRTGYIPVGGPTSPYTAATGEHRSAADLRYTLVCPDPAVAGPGPYPTAFIYSGYSHNPSLQGAGRTPAEFNRRRYAVLAVSPRGANCSSGRYAFGQSDEARDGYDVIEWVASQGWSDKKVAMVGESYAAILQFPVAALRPPHLVAIAGQHPIADLYRDVIYPGGIFNAGVATTFGPFQQAQSLVGTTQAVAADVAAVPASGLPGPECAKQLNREDPALWAKSQPWDGPSYQSRAAYEGLSNISVPVWAVMSWQDDTVGPRGAHMLADIEHLHATISNGSHDQGTAPRIVRDRDAFLDYYVQGKCTTPWRESSKVMFEDGCVDGVYSAPRIRVWWESNRNRDGGWTSSISDWPAPAEPAMYFLSGHGDGSTGQLDPLGPDDGSDSYGYVGGSGRAKSEQAWATGPTPGRSLTYTSPPLRHDVAMLGTGSLDLWLASTATDTDLQVTMSEVRPKDFARPAGAHGEVYVQQGWLRATHRALDMERSRPLLPYHSHLEHDAQPLTPGEARFMRLEILPFGHVFRKGSRIRIDIEAPKIVPDRWAFEPIASPGTNTVFHDHARPSRLVLPVLAVQPEIPREGPPCGGLRAQPCRDVATPRP
jgi:putative CocE/NonD family hydrolase